MMRLAIGLAALAGACATYDPTEDFDAAAARASDRLGTAIDWSAVWRAPAPLPLPEAPLSSDAAVVLALHNHPEIGRALAELAAAKAAWAKAGRLPNPMFDVMVGIPVDGIGGDPWTAALLQPLTWLWTRGLRAERAAAELQAQALRACDLAVATAAAARTAHAQVVFAERGVALASQLRDATAAARDVVARRLAVGEATELEHGRVALEALDADDVAAQAELRLREAQQKLIAACGLAATDSRVRCDGTAPHLPEVALTDADALRIARDRFDVQAAVAAAQAAAAGTRLAQRDRWPEVSAGARYERMEDGREIVFPVLQFVPKLFDDGGAGVAAAEANARAALSAAEAAWQRAVTQLRIDLARYATACAAARRQREAIVPLAQQVSAAAAAALQAGALDPGTALEARVRAARAELAANAAELAAATAFFELGRDAGARLFARAESPP